MQIRLKVYHPLFFSDFWKTQIWSLIILLIHVRVWEYFSLQLQDMLSEPVPLFLYLCLFSDTHFS